ncbi:ATP-grasp domain-containing protein [Streptomyces sp. NBC_01218]|uniref:ATP-grasp domain-containing protein n=1 Tax=Streptomyces sp. NBC_01218 TaxID=2903780 RepID=UPI002E1532DC|nr:ATP-grasp domain-containing protein [Streptomyces sp. NBC_01218]
MNPERTLLLVGATDETLIKAEALGLHVLLLQHPTKITPEQERLVDLVRVVDFTRWDAVEPIARELHEAPGFAAALSLTEPGLEAAASINDLFGLGGTGHEVALRFRDKGVMRRHFAAVDPDAVQAAPLRARADLDAFGSRHGYPFIVKPTDATASIGVRRVDGPADVEEVWDEVQRLVGTRTDRISTLFILQDFLMEEYLDGPEYSVEAFSFAGRHVVAAITEKFTDPAHCAELGHAVPARLPSGAQEQVRQSVGRFLDLIGYRDGVSHTEIRIGKDGPRVIESHNRVAGDAIPELVRSAYGIDLMTLALGWPFRLVEELPDRPMAHAGASVRVLVGEPGGRVESVEGVAEALRQEGVLDVRISAKPGDDVRAVRDNWDRLGLVAVAGPDTTAAVRRGAEVIRDTIKVRVLGADGRPLLAEAAPVTEWTVESA